MSLQALKSLLRFRSLIVDFISALFSNVLHILLSVLSFQSQHHSLYCFDV